ncbi:Isopentenyl phosphate kinase-like protein [Drosera capensis]
MKQIGDETECITNPNSTAEIPDAANSSNFDRVLCFSRAVSIFNQFFLYTCFWKTDVFGVYDRPPSEPDAILLREIAVDEEGSWSVMQPALPNIKNQVKITVAAHDTTGGMVTKISEAAAIAKLGIDVYIVKVTFYYCWVAATDYAFKALKGEMKGKIPADWMGTAIRFSVIR